MHARFLTHNAGLGKHITGLSYYMTSDNDNTHRDLEVNALTSFP